MEVYIKRHCQKHFVPQFLSIFQYYLVKERNVKADGTPYISKKKQINSSTGKEEEVYDYEAMYNVHFQKVNLGETNIKKSLLDSKNKVDFRNVVFENEGEYTTEVYFNNILLGSNPIYVKGRR